AGGRARGAPRGVAGDIDGRVWLSARRGRARVRGRGAPSARGPPRDRGGALLAVRPRRLRGVRARAAARRGLTLAMAPAGAIANLRNSAQTCAKPLRLAAGEWPQPGTSSDSRASHKAGVGSAAANPIL